MPAWGLIYSSFSTFNFWPLCCCIFEVHGHGAHGRGVSFLQWDSFSPVPLCLLWDFQSHTGPWEPIPSLPTLCPSLSPLCTPRASLHFSAFKRTALSSAVTFLLLTPSSVTFPSNTAASLSQRSSFIFLNLLHLSLIYLLNLFSNLLNTLSLMILSFVPGCS